MFKKIVVAVALVASLTLGPAAIRVRAQDSAPAKSAAETGEPGHSYRLDFTLNEIEDGKKINSRQYAMNLNSGDQSELKIGTRVPVEVKQSEIQYLDVGTSIWCRLRDRGTKFVIRVLIHLQAPEPFGANSRFARLSQGLETGVRLISMAVLAQGLALLGRCGTGQARAGERSQQCRSQSPGLVGLPFHLSSSC